MAKQWKLVFGLPRGNRSWIEDKRREKNGKETFNRNGLQEF